MKNNSMICMRCYTVGNPRKATRGSFIIELFLWCCFIIPGLIYSLWRLTTKHFECGACHAEESMIPLDTPLGQTLLNRETIG